MFSTNKYHWETKILFNCIFGSLSNSSFKTISFEAKNGNDASYNFSNRICLFVRLQQFEEPVNQFAVCLCDMFFKTIEKLIYNVTIDAHGSVLMSICIVKLLSHKKAVR